MDDFFEYGDSVFTVSDSRIEIKEKKAQSIFFLFLIALPPLITLACLVAFAPEIGEQKPVGYVILTLWFLIGMFVYFYRKDIKLDLIKGRISYETSVLRFTLGYLSRPISEIVAVDCWKQGSRDEGYVYILEITVGRKRLELNRTPSKEAGQAQKDFLCKWLGLDSDISVT